MKKKKEARISLSRIRICARPGCDIWLRGHNKSGLCKVHNKGKKSAATVLAKLQPKPLPKPKPKIKVPKATPADPVQHLTLVCLALKLNPHEVLCRLAADWLARLHETVTT